MKIFPDGFAGKIALKTGTKPVWILKLSIGGNALYLSENEFTVASWMGGITTKPWVKSFGEIKEGLTNSLGEFKIADLIVQCLNDTSIDENLEYYLVNFTPEKDPAQLFLWDHDLNPITDPPQEFFRGYIKDYPFLDDYNVEMQIQDETLKLEKTYIGNKVSLIQYPSADPDDVGKVIPIPFGTINKLRALAVDAGAMTSLPNNINKTTTVITVSDGFQLSAGMTVQIDDEQIYIRALSGDIITDCIRGYNFTVTNNHLKGAMLWEKKSSFVYIYSDVPMDTVGKVFGRVGDAELDITAICGRYTGQPGNELAGYSGKGVVTVPGYVTTQQAVDLLIADGIDVLDALGIHDYSVRDLVVIQDTHAVVDPTGVNGNASTDQGTHTHSVSTNPVAYSGNNAFPGGSNVEYVGVSSYLYDNNPSSCLYAHRKYGSGSWQGIMTVYFPGYSGVTPGAVYACINCVGSGGAGTTITFNGTNIGLAAGARRIYMGTTPPSQLTVRIDSNEGTASLTVYEIWYEVQASATSSNPAAGVNTSMSVWKTGGSVYDNGKATKIGLVDQVGLADRYGDVSKTGTTTLYGNSVANTLVGDEILVNATRNITDPDDVISSILSTYCNVSSFSLVGSLPAYFKFNGAITEYRTAIWWLNYLAMQCRCYFRMHLGTAKLIYRPDTITPLKNISACRITDDGRRVLQRQQSPYEEIINTVQILFDRDYSKTGRDEHSYQGVSRDSNQSSIDDFGERESPALFMFDFVTSQTMADNLRDFYLDYHSRRHWIYSLEAYMPHADLEFPDGVTLGFVNNALCEVAEARFAPGNTGQLDIVKLIAKEA